MRYPMRATDFEVRHQTLLHLLVVALAFLAYAVQPDDIVWAFVKHHTIYRTLLERLVFGTGALVVLCSAILLTWANAYRSPRADAENPLVACDGPYRYFQHPVYFGRLLFALGIGLLAPMAGTAILLTGEVVLVLRLLVRERERPMADTLRQYRIRVQEFLPSFRSPFPAQGLPPNWKKGFRNEASKWGLAVTMIVFTLTLRDRVAEFLAGASFLLWFVLNLPYLLGQHLRG
jgi:protein-S-isoprenylcysteine O-methyltransferase Ste14